MSRLRNKFLKNKSLENRKLYTQQRNYSVSLWKKSNMRYYANFNEEKFLAVKPFFSDKSTSRDKINLTENGEHVKTGMKTEDVFLKYGKESWDFSVLKF